MRSHQEINSKAVFTQFDNPTDFAVYQNNKTISRSNTNFNGLPLYRIEGEVGLYTEAELNRRFSN